jgi:hypothetical protein
LLSAGVTSASAWTPGAPAPTLPATTPR